MKKRLHALKKTAFWLFPLWLVVALFGTAGRIDIPVFWLYSVIMSAGIMLSHLLIDPSLQDERITPGGRDADKISRHLISRLIVIVWLVAGFDVGRLHWTDVIPSWLQYASLILLIPSMAFMIWAMRVNRFFASAVRIQQERGHHVITAGPYKYVRHPGYIAMIAVFLFGGFSLGSLAALMPTFILIAVLIGRTFFEDKFLQKNLPGYSQYASSIKYRLLPFIW